MAKKKKYSPAERKAKIAKGLCGFQYCKEKHRENKTTCVKHGKLVADASTRRLNRIRGVIKQLNLKSCSSCLQENDRHDEGYATCSKCKSRKYDSDKEKEKRAQFVKEGKCSRCGKERDEEDCLTCKKCRTLTGQQKEDRNERVKKDREFAIKHRKCVGCFVKLDDDCEYKNCDECRKKNANSAKKQRKRKTRLDGKPKKVKKMTDEQIQHLRQNFTRKPKKKGESI